MKLIVLILFPFFANAQYAQWTTGNENAVVSYQVETSADLKTWATLPAVQPKRADTNTYQVAIPKTSLYVRIKSNMISNSFYTSSLYLYKKPDLLIIPKISNIQLL
jgi:hypothetical protein